MSQNKNCELSVIFPTYNRPAEAAETLALLSKHIPVPYEVIILDNSPDAYSFDLKDNEKYIFLDENMGTASRNIGIEKARGKYILLLDDDSHPFPGSVETALSALENSPPEVTGINGPILRPDGGRENPPLLPTAFHGCGVMFRADVLKKLNPFYPEDFCFYGEEYLSTLLFFKAGCRFDFVPEFKVCHRMSSKGREKTKILYRLTLNNRRTWLPFVPEQYLKKTEYDTARRYELIAKKEGVQDAFLKAMSEKINIRMYDGKMTDESFEAFSLLSDFKKLVESGKLEKGKSIVLCGCGKFPTLWAGFLKSRGIPEVLISDFNPGLIEQTYSKYTVLCPEKMPSLAKKGFQFICGHSARTDTEENWKPLLAKHGIKAVNLF